MELRNYTAFPALGMEGVDQHQQEFHSIVLRQTFSITAQGLQIAAEQSELCEVDTFFGEMNRSSVRQESDLCHFKPRCDVIFNGSAYAPGAQASSHFPVRLVVRRPDTPRPLPAEPQSLNPQMRPSAQQISAWQNEVEYARSHPIPGKILLDKALRISGRRMFVRKALPQRVLTKALQLGTLGLAENNPWSLTDAEKIQSLPLRDEYAYGGQARINYADDIANKIEAKYCLSASERATHPDHALAISQQAILHRVCASNPFGQGYAFLPHLQASQCNQVAAPQIEDTDKLIDAPQFWQALQEEMSGAQERKIREPAGFGIRPKWHPLRSKLCGTINQQFIDSNRALPEDFNFAVWNAARPEQQLDYLCGDEVIELFNLCPANTPGAGPGP